MARRGFRVQVGRTTLALASYASIVAAFRMGIAHSSMAIALGEKLPYAFSSFVLLVAPLWFMSFGPGDWLRNRSRWLRIFLPALLGIPYLVFAIPAQSFEARPAALMFVLPVLVAAALDSDAFAPRLVWQDLLVLSVLAATYLLRLLDRAWPYAGLAVLPKLYVADLALYLYLVVRRLEGIGYTFFAKASALATGLREWLYFAPLGVGLGLALGFIHFHAHAPSLPGLLTSLLLTFLLIAIPEELFFRGIVQNLLETRLGRLGALVTAAGLFGLSHFHQGASFNWRYVLLASIAGVFYGRAWRAERQLLAAVITHTAVDVVWSLWFK
jgi:uncharacterized protein